jgi:hypothetical protein
MNSLGLFGFLLLAVVVSAFIFSVGAIAVLLVRNLITRRPIETGLGTWLFYPVIATVLIAGLVGSQLYAANKGIGEYTAVKWLNILITANFVFGYAGKRFWRFRTEWTFWAGLGVLLVAHIAVLSRLHWGKAGYFWLPVVIGVPELAFVYFVLRLMLDPRGTLTEQDPR